MDIFLLFVFNIFTGAVIFLILSLKIEKHSSTFQEKKLKREMGEIITEFNSTAERNINLLENRISVLKKLLNDNGSLKGVDFTVLDDKMRNNFNKSNEEIKEIGSLDKLNEKLSKRDIDDNKPDSKKDDHTIIGTFVDKIQSFKRIEESISDKERIKKAYIGESKKNEEMSRESFTIIERDVKDINIKSSRIDLSADEDIVIKYKEEKSVDIEELFHNAEDKYNLIAKLFNEGHSVEELSEYSGIPAGEIKLVISLNS